MPEGLSTAVQTIWCNVYGGENSGPDAVKYLGGASDWHPSKSKGGRFWYCPTPAVGRFRMVCTHGHRGQIMYLCQNHYDQYKTGVKFCPRCHEPGKELHPQQQCDLHLEPVS